MSCILFITNFLKVKIKSSEELSFIKKNKKVLRRNMSSSRLNMKITNFTKSISKMQLTQTTNLRILLNVCYKVYKHKGAKYDTSFVISDGVDSRNINLLAYRDSKLSTNIKQSLTNLMLNDAKNRTRFA